MRQLHFAYEMLIQYTIPVGKCNFTIKCIPKDTSRQKISDYQIDLFPETQYSFGMDGLRNIQIYGANEEAHDTFRFQIEGNVITGCSEYEEEVNEDVSMIFGHPHGLNIPGDGIREYYENHKPDSELNLYEKALFMMHELYHYLEYAPFSTTVDTTAEQAFLQRKGVCQDYAHIFISLLHLAGIPARYVTGLIVGEGASHAWVEILWEGKWYGLDPTNDKEVFDEHIKIGVGRDARDCMINRGIMHGNGEHIQTIKVSVNEI